jgi:hypothetical protein
MSIPAETPPAGKVFYREVRVWLARWLAPAAG